MRRTQPDTTRIASEAHLPDSYQNHVTHWWDGSQIYGSDLETSNSIREFQGGRLTVNSDGTLPREFFSGLPKTGLWITGGSV